MPQSAAERLRIRSATESYVREHGLVPPLPLDELQVHTAAICNDCDIESRFADFVTILISNTLWWGTVASIPYDRRVFLLPQCLRDRRACQAEMDEFGLLCMQCGSCPIGTLQQEAEELGYVFLVAEGTTVVTKLLESGKVDAVIGVSCLETLERTFPHMSAHAIPGIAIPLIQDGCEDTVMDTEWIAEVMRLRNPDGFPRRRTLAELHSEVDTWFESEALRTEMGAGDTETEKAAAAWLARAGKRWRPFLVVSVYTALRGDSDRIPASVRRAAIAVECFHKASLIHDDIEDGDDVRYDQPTLHREYGIPVALNVGDLLLGEGYRLIGSLDTPPQEIAEMLAVSAEGHRTLCLGQGEELNWMQNPRPLSVQEVLEIFRHKTAPAFEVALRLGAICAGSGEETAVALKRFSRALGAAYQIRDDIEDFGTGQESGDAVALRPSILMALLYEGGGAEERSDLEQLWQKGRTSREELAGLKRSAERLGVAEKAQQLFEHHRNEALRSLAPLQNAELKSLLHRITGKIL